MKVALTININFQSRLEIPMRQIVRAEQLGFDSVWAAESYGSDALTPLAYIGALTKRIRLGNCIAQLAARTPTNLAMCAQTIDAMVGEGRMIIGIGVSGPQIVEGWYGQPWGNPAERIRDYVAIIRKILAREGPVTHEGKEISLPYRGPGSSGLGKPLKSILHGNPNIPIMLGTATPGNIRMTAEIADGWIAMHLVPDSLKDYLPLLAEGFAKRRDGRTLKDFEIRGFVSVNITNDVKQAIDQAKPQLARTLGAAGPKKKNYHNDAMVRRGYPEAAARIQELYLAGRKKEAAAAVPDEFIDEEGLIGPPDRIKERWARWRDSGITMLSIIGPTYENLSEEAVELIGGLIHT